MVLYLRHPPIPLQLWSQRGTPPALRVGFLWTEDPSVAAFLLREGPHALRPAEPGADDAEWLWLRHPAAGARRTDMAPGSWHDGGEDGSPSRFAALADEFFLSLFLSLECGGGRVGTWGSNQDRLLGELAGVLLPATGAGGAGGARANFVEVTRS